MAIKIYTKTGDKGETGLFGGKRLPKCHIRIETYGTVDELNSWIGLVRDSLTDSQTREALHKIQSLLFSMGANLASDPEKGVGSQSVSAGDIEFLEKEIDRMESLLPVLKNFILPGGHPSVSNCHVARCVCRRAERNAVALNMEEIVESEIITYLNRLSDYLFVLSRRIAQLHGVEEVLWKSR